MEVYDGHFGFTLQYFCGVLTDIHKRKETLKTWLYTILSKVYIDSLPDINSQGHTSW